MGFRTICFTIVLILWSLFSFGFSIDSLRMESKGGIKYIVHKVEPKETLFSISRRYKVKVGDIIDANEGTEDGLKMYQELFIPFKSTDTKKEEPVLNGKEVFHNVAQGETLYSISRKYNISIDSLRALNNLASYDLALNDKLIVGYNEAKRLTQKTDTTETKVVEDENTHKVVASETLYSISRQYDIDLKELKTLNSLDDNSLDIGQILILRKGATIKVADSLKEQPDVIPPVDTVYLKTDNSRFKEKKEQVGNLEKTSEEGFAMKIDGTTDTRKYLALHRFVPIGTIIEVENNMNGRSIFARVVGKLPETGMNKNVLIRISSAAYMKLGALDAKIPVEIGYVLD